MAPFKDEDLRDIIVRQQNTIDRLEEALTWIEDSEPELVDYAREKFL